MNAIPISGQLFDHDVGATDPRWTCVKADEIVDVARLGYWAWKTFKWIDSIP